MRPLLTRLATAFAIGSLLLAPSPVQAHTGLEPKTITVCKPMYDCDHQLPTRKLYTRYFETQYIQRVLPNEWLCSWSSAAVKAGAVAVRTYGWWRVEHPRTAEFDIYGDANDQVFKDTSENATCDSRIAATAGTRLEYQGDRKKDPVPRGDW
jgi:hypothetical protein